MAFVGYARVSSVGQSLDVQLEKLQQCDKVFQEKLSGTSSKRPPLKASLEYVREGDTLVITRLDRLARSTLDLCQIAAELERKTFICGYWTRVLIPAMPRAGYCSICSAQLASLRRRFGANGSGKG